MGNSKIIYAGETLIDLTSDTIAEDNLLKGYTAHGADGDQVVGTCEYDANTSDATAAETDILSGKTAYVNGAKKTGSMKNNGAVSGTISTKAGTYTVSAGYHNGSGKVAISSTEQAKVIAGNIKKGVTLLGVAGSLPNSLVFYNKTVATSAWASNTTYSDYPYRASVACSGVTASFTPYVMFSDADVANGILCPDANSYSGGVYIYASEKPTTSVVIDEIICIGA